MKYFEITKKFASELTSNIQHEYKHSYICSMQSRI